MGLQRLTLSGNAFSGILPSKGFYSALEYLYLHSNLLSGSLPTAWGSSSASKMKVFRVSQNLISGTLPAGLISGIRDHVQIG